MQTKIQNLTAELQNAYKSMQTEIETLRQKNRELSRNNLSLDMFDKRINLGQKFKDLLEENEALKKEIAELSIQKHTLRKENKRLKKRRRSGRYDINTFIKKLTEGYFVYVEGGNRPTKLHTSIDEAFTEAERLAKLNKGRFVKVLGALRTYKEF